MNCSEKKPILSIIISTYNRNGILRRNLDRMLAVDGEDFEFIVGDNGSNDSTWEVLCHYDDPRLNVYRNEKNLGFENFWLLSEYARGKFFIFLNDRDYIDQYGMHDMCNMLFHVAKCDFVSCEWRKNKVGLYHHENAMKVYFDSRHPGMLIYDKSFISMALDLNEIRRKLNCGKSAEANMYIVFNLLKKMQTVYVHDSEYVIQPPNRERIEKKRKEYYSAPYISLEYRQKELSDWFRYADLIQDQTGVNNILLAMIRDSLLTVTWEYYISMKIPGFAKRNNYENHKYEEWLLNGVTFSLYVFAECIKHRRNIKMKILAILFSNYKVCFKKLIGN